MKIRWTVVRRGLGLAAMFVGAALPQGATAQDPLAGTEPADSAATGPGVSAVGAFARSVVLPGWGQAYVGSPGRGAVYFAMEAGTAWMTYKTWRQLEEARDVQGWMRDTGLLGETEKFDLVDAREQQFEDWITLSIFVLLFSGVDAFVTAQLADFGEHVGVRPTAGGGLGLEARLPTGPRR